MKYGYSIFECGNGEKEHCLELSGHIVANLMERENADWMDKDLDAVPHIVHTKLAAQHSRVSLVPVPYVATGGKDHRWTAMDAFEEIVEKLNERIEKRV